MAIHRVEREAQEKRFLERGSTDGVYEVIQEVISQRPELDGKPFRQSRVGKSLMLS